VEFRLPGEAPGHIFMTNRGIRVLIWAQGGYNRLNREILQKYLYFTPETDEKLNNR